MTVDGTCVGRIPRETSGGGGYERIIHYGMGTVEIGAGRRLQAHPPACVAFAWTANTVSENF